MNSKIKKSTDFNDIDMAIVHEVMTFVVKPLIYILNVSLQTGVFLDNMKIAKVIFTKMVTAIYCQL